MRRIFPLLCAVAASLVARDARAQDEPRFGVTMGFPAAVGVIWNVADRLALRPEVTLSGTSTSSDSAIAPILGLDTGSTGDGFQFGVGVSALIYLSRWDALRTYVSPRFSYSHATNTGTSLGSSSDTTSRSYFTSGSFGAQYAFARHFGVFGEIGVGYTSATTTLSTTSTPVIVLPVPGPSFPPVTTRLENHGKTWSTRSGVGVIFYF
jgi:hypothetical protein